MSTNKKRVLAGVLALGSLAIWIPQILGQRGEGSSGSAALDAEFAVTAEVSRPMDGGGDPADDAPHDDASYGRRDPAPAVREPGRTAAGPASPTHLEGTAADGGPGQNFGAPTQTDLLGRLSKAWGEVSAPLPPQGPQAAAARPGSEPTDPAAEARAFLEQNPLAGVLLGPESAVALFGARVVRAGDELVPGKVTVQAIGRRHVELGVAGGALRVELPPIVARPTGDPANDSATDGGAPAVDAPSAPADSVAPIPPSESQEP